MNNKFKEKFEKKLLEILKKYDNKKYGCCRHQSDDRYLHH